MNKSQILDKLEKPLPPIDMKEVMSYGARADTIRNFGQALLKFLTDCGVLVGSPIQEFPTKIGTGYYIYTFFVRPSLKEENYLKKFTCIISNKANVRYEVFSFNIPAWNVVDLNHKETPTFLSIELSIKELVKCIEFLLPFK